MGSTPNWPYGYQPSAVQWNAAFAAKQDQIAYTPTSEGGDTLTGPLITTASIASSAGFGITPGVAPTTPNPGDMWVQSGSGLYVYTGSFTMGPGQQPGTNTNDNALAGNIDELIAVTIGSGAGIALVSGIANNVTNITLSPGDWDVNAEQWLSSGTSSILLSLGAIGLSTISATLPTPSLGSDTVNRFSAPSGSYQMANAGNLLLRVGPSRFSLAATTTIYMVSQATFSGVGVLVAYGTIRARRIR